MRKMFPFKYVVLFVVFDQIIKYLCLKKLKIIGSIEVIKDFFYLTYVENKGAAFGMLQGARWIFIVISLIAIIFCIWYFKNLPKDKFLKINKVSIVLIISGAIGNMIDRFFRGYVIDMFHFIFFGKDFAVFNVADILVCVGTFLFAVSIILSDNSKNKERKGRLD